MNKNIIAHEKHIENLYKVCDSLADRATILNEMIKRLTERLNKIDNKKGNN